MNGQMQTLVVDDDAGVRFFITESLKKLDCVLTIATNGEEAMEKLRNTSFDLILLDLNLGGRIDGMRVLEATKWRWPETSVIILTANDELDSALAAIQEDVDGYLIKPVTSQKLRQTINTVLNRKRKPISAPQNSPAPHDLKQILRFRDIVIDQEKHTVTVNNQVVSFSTSEFKLLAYLIENKDRVVPPQELVQEVRGYQCEYEREAREIIKWYIHSLRQKLQNNAAKKDYIRTVRGVGYSLQEE